MAFLASGDGTGVRFKDVYQGIERDSMAYRLLASMGWREGDGLVRDHLQLAERDDLR
jgi:G-patch domain